MSQMPTGTVTLLFTDIEGSTRLLQQLGERYARDASNVPRLLRTAFQHGTASRWTRKGMRSSSSLLGRAMPSSSVSMQRALTSHDGPRVWRSCANRSAYG